MSASCPAVRPPVAAWRLSLRIALVAALLAALYMPPGHAQPSSAWPSRPVRLLVGLPPGGTTDLMARATAARLAEGIAQTVLVDNRPGASGAIAGELIARATPDGHTLGLVTTSTHSVAPLLVSVPRFDPRRDFTHVTLVGTTPYVLLSSAAFPAKTMREAIDYLRANSGRLNYASAGAGTLGHLITEAFLTELRVTMTHVPYKGAAPVYPELMADRVSLFFDNPGSSVQLVKAGKVRALAVSRPVAVLPGVPTLVEAGLKGFDPVFWYGVVGPAGLPRPVVDRVQGELAKSFATEAGRAELAGFGVDPVLSRPEAFEAQNRSDIERWGRVARSLGLKLD
ncbi:MAG: Bug family tripartite tricarboxylate transporter substrate binding protein [bacterium]|jgi:tripartite-type tricarboxylate transporter receptor subunit TctC|nr:tripartite tricarboxylate transporter substrate binding protein [Betaproteobacteria bacterium]